MIRRIVTLSLTLLCISSAHNGFQIGFYKMSSDALRSADFKIGMEVWVKELARNHDIHTHVRYYSDPKKLYEDFRDGAINMAVATPLVFVKYFDTSLMLPGIVGFKTSKEKSSQTLLLVRKEDISKPLKNMLQRTVAVSKLADSGKLYVRYLGLKHGIETPIRFLETKNGGQAILKLFFGKSDVAITSQATYDIARELNPQVGERIVPYKRVDLPIGSYAYIRKGIDPRLYDDIIRYSLQIPETTRGKQVLVMFQTDTVETCTLKDLETTRRLYQEYTKLKRNDSGKSSDPRNEKLQRTDTQ